MTSTNEGVAALIIFGMLFLMLFIVFVISARRASRLRGNVYSLEKDGFSFDHVLQGGVVLAVDEGQRELAFVSADHIARIPFQDIDDWRPRCRRPGGGFNSWCLEFDIRDNKSPQRHVCELTLQTAESWTEKLKAVFNG